MRLIILIAASWPSKRLAAVTILTLLVGLYGFTWVLLTGLVESAWSVSIEVKNANLTNRYSILY
jgi:hypothetical protein